MNDSVRRRTSAAGALVLVLAVAVLSACSSGGDDSSVAGSYLSPGKGAIVLAPDGRFAIVEANRTAATGTYSIDGNKITFTIGGQKAGTGTIEGDKLTDPDGNVFTKVAGTPSIPPS
ncbi:MAG TPA: hypothetical protein VNN79_19120 [Actinomycetota bacterium]|jgi:hypothetical protein|nr:hypothetical protein [Actinomycetota bacterium]